jgi:hypothetical protein
MSNISDYGQRNFQTPGDNQSADDWQQGGKADLMQEAQGFGRDMKNKAAGLGDSIAEGAREQVSGVKDAASKLGSKVGDKVNQAFQEQKGAGADYLRHLAGAVRRAAGEVEGDIPPAAKMMRTAADSVESFASSVSDKNAQEILGEVQDFARRQPALFFGGAMLLGFAALRFLKSAPPAGNSSYRQGV